MMAKRLSATQTLDANLERLRRQTRTYKGIVMVQCGLSWVVWLDYVTERHMQPSFPTLAKAKTAISQHCLCCDIDRAANARKEL